MARAAARRRERLPMVRPIIQSTTGGPDYGESGGASGGDSCLSNTSYYY